MIYPKRSIPVNCKLFSFLTAISIISFLTLGSFPVLAEKFYSRFTLFQPSAYTNYPYRGSKRTISDILAKNKKFTTLVNQLKEANLLDTLKRPGYFIIFAPTDDAFNALPDNVLKRYSQPENRMKVLKYHLISGKITPQQLNNAVITTLSGSQIKITDTPEGTVKLNDANVKYPPITTTNGMIIEIDKVLLPSDF
ncbi:fasciclin domain-containing protein [Mastigocladus laminosus UU774]|nr:fasciclin domain-containing protein [Mastigocladus laminosus UU774]